MGQTRENILLTMSVPDVYCFVGGLCPLNLKYTFYVQNVTKLHIKTHIFFVITCSFRISVKQKQVLRHFKYIHIKCKSLENEWTNKTHTFRHVYKI